MKAAVLTFLSMAILTFASAPSLAQLQERPQIPREWYADVVLWHYGENRPERQAAGCLRWATHTRTWYDVCQGAPLRVRY